MPNEQPTVDPDRTRYLDDNLELHQIKRSLLDARDAFGNLITSRTNVLDLAAHYPYSSVRWRVLVDGTRQFPEYGSVPQYNHAEDVHELTPGAGETVVFESAERPRYVVQYELAATWAFRTNQALTGNDRIRIGLYDGTDGWYMEHRGDHPDSQTADFVLERAGSEVYRKTDIDIAQGVETWARLKLKTGWYDITRQEWQRSYPVDGRQENPVIGEFSADAMRGSRTGNLPIHYEVTADDAGSGLVLEAGSAAQVNLGATTRLIRTKTVEFTYSVDTTDTWVPAEAFRADPDRGAVDIQIRDTDVVEFSGSGDVRVMPVGFDLSNLADSGGAALQDGDFSTPEEVSATNSVIETTTAVDQFPDSSGAVGTSTADPGGYQLGYASSHASGTGSKTSIQSGSSTPKRSVLRDDICVFLAKADTTGDVTLEYVVEEDW